MASNASIGTKHAGYAPPWKGPFKCGHCAHFASPHFCNQPDVLEDAKAGDMKMSKGKAIVAEAGCCNYYRPEG